MIERLDPRSRSDMYGQRINRAPAPWRVRSVPYVSIMLGSLAPVLLIADLMLKEGGFGDLLPGADAVVIDEAHQWPDVAAQFLGWSVGTRQIGAILLAHRPLEELWKRGHHPGGLPRVEGRAGPGPSDNR
jgi:hypothetical protein